jgi:hypothetical protein
MGLASCALLAACATPGVGLDDVTPIEDASPDVRPPQGDASFHPQADASAANEDGGPPDASMSADASVVDASVVDASVVDSGSLCASKFTGTLVTFDFAAAPGNQASTAPKSSAAGITAGSLSRSASLTAVTGTSSINASNWSLLSKPDPARYYTFTLTPDPNCALDITSVSLDSKSSASGPGDGAVATSVDAFGATTSFVTGTPGTVSLSVSKATNAVELRVYGYNATAAGGTMRLQTTVTVTGTLH